MGVGSWLGGLAVLLLAVGPALASETGLGEAGLGEAGLGETGLGEEAWPSWVQIPNFEPTAPLLGQDFNRVVAELWQHMQRREGERETELNAACRQVVVTADYLRDRVPRQIADARQQMAAHPQELKLARLNPGPGLLDTKHLGRDYSSVTDSRAADDDDEFGADAVLDQIRAGDEAYRADYDYLLRRYLGIELGDYLDAGGDLRPVTQGEFLHHVRVMSDQMPLPNWWSEAVTDLLADFHRAAQEVFDLLREVRRSLSLLSHDTAQQKGIPTISDRLPAGPRTLEKGYVLTALRPYLLDDQPVSRRQFLVNLMTFVDMIEGRSYTPVMFCGDSRGLLSEDEVQRIQDEMVQMSRDLEAVHLDILTLARELGYR